MLDVHPHLIVRVRGQGLFAPDNADGLSFTEVTARKGEGRIEIEEGRRTPVGRAVLISTEPAPMTAAQRADIVHSSSCL